MEQRDFAAAISLSRTSRNLAGAIFPILYSPAMRRICFYHAGCPDGLGAAWAVRHAWGDAADYRARGHDDTVDLDGLDGCQVVYVDFAPPNDELIELAETAAQLIVLDHHLSARDRIEADPAVDNALAGRGHEIVMDLSHSGSVLSWNYFAPTEPVPDLLRYVEDQDLWSWKLPRSEEVNAAIGSYPRDFETWSRLAARPSAELAEEVLGLMKIDGRYGTPITCRRSTGRRACACSCRTWSTCSRPSGAAC